MSDCSRVRPDQSSNLFRSKLQPNALIGNALGGRELQMASKTGSCIVGLALIALSWRLAAAEASQNEGEINFKVTAPTMVGALIQFSQQSGLQLVYPADSTTGLAAPKIE